ncbi:hypothetical protein [Picrophilus oshimae]|uniref:Uncharacterized protein n=1 Tax=Picrophilus torridus (strain ATCC 700027 / DSM 9790 / JCM 10055 / NBRC 100828 / KAW 2/3) TaxID=1122961 RepID=Q6KZS0_PICTO|nr:hypothetical protein [Picrophilus oshimae]AAT43782.1 hypothetical protein PTO1197 [Picrophilus oshimae DSM 9789]
MKKTIIQINIEVPEFVNELGSEALKYARGLLELTNFALKTVNKNQDGNKKSSLKKIDIK